MKEKKEEKNFSEYIKSKMYKALAFENSFLKQKEDDI
jgi:hypothetical protein